MHEHSVMAFAVILLAGMACQWIAWRVKLPAIIFLLLTGILAGPATGWLNPDQLFGELLFPFVSLAVAVILFEGSLTLRFHEISGLERVIRNLITTGAAVTWLVTTIAARGLVGFSWEVSFLFGAFMVVTGPTVIVPMLRTVRPKEHAANILRWEGILIDPIGATLAVLVYQFIVAEGMAAGFASGLLIFGKILLIGAGMGAAGGGLFGILLRRHWIPQFLQDFSALAMVCGVFAISNLLEAESGLLSVTVMGIFLANMKGLDLEDILDFKESLSILLISTLFIVLAARMDLQGFAELGWPALGVFVVVQFIARPLTVHLSSLGSQLPMAERHLLSWIAPRGIVAAAISALFALKLEAIGFEGSSQMAPLTFLMIFGTVFLQSATAGPLAKRLNVAEPDPKGFLIVGANAVAQAIALALKENGFRVLLTDRNWDRVTEAKMKGLDAYWGNPVSEHAERRLNLVGIGQLLALTSNSELNALAAQHYRMEFGSNNIYAIRNQEPEDRKLQKNLDFKRSGRPIFGVSTVFGDLAERLAKGAEIKTTLLTEKFTFEEYLRETDGLRLPLFAIDPRGRLRVFTDRPDFAPKADWRIVGLSSKQFL